VRIPFWIGMGLLFGFVLPYTLILNKRVQDRFNDLVFRRTHPCLCAPAATGRGHADDVRLHWNWS
jgi:hypothetical protein